MLGAGLEPASLSAYAPQTYVSANSTTRASLGARANLPQSNTPRKSRMAFLLLILVIVIEIATTGSKVFEHEREYEHE